MRRRLLALTANVIGFTGMISVGVAAGLHFEGQNGTVPAPFRAAAPLPPLSYLGVYEPGAPHAYSGVLRFGNLVGRRPNLALYYSSWWEPFQVSFAQSAQASQAIPMVQLEPRDIDLRGIAAGVYDRYLRMFARSVQSFGGPVVFSFGHEMNADWYGWGYRHTSPAVFVAAWRHIHQVFASQGASNITWLWTVNVVGGPDCGPIRAWWPGSDYVTWVGVDGHYFTKSVRFASLFGATLGQVRRITNDPILVSEAGIAPFVETNRITDLFAGAQAHHLIGVVWFDVPGHNLRIEGDPIAIAEFRQAVHKFF
jgi:hypothetical protein